MDPTQETLSGQIAFLLVRIGEVQGSTNGRLESLSKDFANSAREQGKRIGLLETAQEVARVEVAALSDKINGQLTTTLRSNLMIFGLIQAVGMAIFVSLLNHYWH